MVLLIALIGDGFTAAAAVVVFVVMVVVVVGVKRIPIAGWATSRVLEASGLVLSVQLKPELKKIERI